MWTSYLIIMSKDISIPWKDESLHIKPAKSSNLNTGFDPVFTLFAEVKPCWKELDDILQNYKNIKTPPQGHHHITVKLFGKTDNVSELISEINDHLENFGPISIDLIGADVFPTCVYIPVHDTDGRLEDIHHDLENVSPPTEFEGENYLPHVTAGKFTGTQNIDSLIHDISEYTEKEWGSYEINRLYLVKDGFESIGPYKSFESIQAFDLTDEKSGKE